MEIKVSIECQDDECKRILQAFRADDTNTWKTKIVENKIVVTISSDKITSLYNLVDDLLRSYEVFKNLDKEQL